MRTLLRSVIQNATITSVDSAGPARLRADGFVLCAAEMLAFEKVQVVEAITGTRFETWIEAAPEGSGEISLHGAGTHLRAGQQISVAVYVALHEGQTLGHTARFVSLDAHNRVVEAIERGIGSA